MSNVVILKLDEEEINEEEALAVIDSIAKNFKLRITIHDRTADEDARYDTLAHMEDMHRNDLEKAVKDGELLPLVDEEHGIIGYVLDREEFLHDFMDVLNGR